MIVYIVFDTSQIIIREARCDENIAYQRCEELDVKWNNPSEAPHIVIKLEVDKEN